MQSDRFPCNVSREKQKGYFLDYVLWFSLLPVICLIALVYSKTKKWAVGRKNYSALSAFLASYKFH